MTRNAIVAAMLAASSIVACSSTSECPKGQTKQPVYRTSGDTSAEYYICLSADESSEQASPPATSRGASSSSAAPPPPPPPPSACGERDAFGPDVAVVAKGGPTPAPADVAPPDGTYALAQASAYGLDGGAAPLHTLRATLEVSGARLLFGGQATTTTLEANETFVLTIAGGVLTKVCESRTGTLSTDLLPGAVGATFAAHTTWDASARLFTLVVASPTATYELLFTPA
jgi:hypothetical protein